MGSVVKRRKAKEERKDTSIRIRLTDEQKTKLEAAAAAAGLDVSGWLRFIGLREADKSGK